MRSLSMTRHAWNGKGSLGIYPFPMYRWANYYWSAFYLNWFHVWRKRACKFPKLPFSQNLFSSVAGFQISPPSSGKDIIKFLLILFNNKNLASSLWSGKVLNFAAGAKRGDIKFGLKSADHSPHKFGPTIVSPTNLTLLPNTEVIKFSNFKWKRLRFQWT